MWRPAAGRCLALVTLVLVAPEAAWALDAAQARGRAEQAIRAIEAEAVKASAKDRLRYRPPTPAQRLAAGDMLLRNKDHERAIDELSKVVELHRQGKMPEAPFADGSFLLAEAYFQSKQYLSARRHYREILERAQQPAFLSYVGRSLSRLVDVALRTGDLDSLDYVFARLNTLPASDTNGSINYARAKALFARGRYTDARSAINAVPANSEYTLQAQYLLGVILTKEAAATIAAAPPAAGAQKATSGPKAAQHYARAVEQFRRVTRMPAKSAAARHVIDFSWMAIGRLLHESDSFLDAAEAYSHVDRQSPEFSSMLHELSWVYVRLGDFQRAQRALEVLTITDPNNLDLADGSLLRADLMLRAGQYDKALSLYRSVRDRFDPVREQVDRFMSANLEPAVYYDKLTADPELSTSGDMPEIALEWARQQAEDERVFSVIDDAHRSRDLLKKARKLAVRLSAVLAVPTRAKAFPETRAAMELTLSLLNRVGRTRVTLAEGMDDVASSAEGELGLVRQERRALMKRMATVPVSSSDFARRDDVGYQQWSRASQALQQLTIEADKLSAIINGLRRVLGQNSGFAVTSDSASRERFRLEIEANERDLEAYQKRIQDFRDAIEMGRIQAGFGDQRFVVDEQTRRRFKEVLAREVDLVAAGHDAGGAVEYAQSIRSVLARADVIDKRLEGLRGDQERHALGQAQALAQRIRDEVALLETYASSLERLDLEARQVVGEVAMRNFGLVRDRLKSVVLRADVGIVQQAWEMREEQRRRVRSLQRERAREEQNLNDELREVIDDGEDDK